MIDPQSREYNVILDDSRNYSYVIEGPTIESISEELHSYNLPHELELGLFGREVIAQIHRVISSDGAADMFIEGSDLKDETRFDAANAHLTRTLGDVFLPRK